MTTINGRIALRYLANVPDDFMFQCFNGTKLRRLSDLSDALNSMSEATFAYHVSEGKNDFSNWVFDTIGDEKLAKDLSALPNRRQYAKRVQKRLEFLRRKLENTSTPISVR